MIPTLFGAAVLVFLLMRAHPRRRLRAAPGDRRRQHRPAGARATAAPSSASTSRCSCSSSVFIKGLVTFDFGNSMWTGRPIIEEIGLRFQLSLQVAIMATLTAILLAIPLGTISAVKQNTWIDYVVRAFSIAGVAMPSFWLGILIILGILITSKALVRHALDAAHQVRADLGRPAVQPEHADLAGAGHRLSLLGGGHPHDALGHARGAARGLRAHRARQGRCSRSSSSAGMRCATRCCRSSPSSASSSPS